MEYLRYKLVMSFAMGPINHIHLFLRYCVEEQHSFVVAVWIYHKSVYKIHSELEVTTKYKLIYSREVDL